MPLYDMLLCVQYAGIALMLFMCAYILKKWKRPLHGWLFFYCAATLINNAGYLAHMLSRTEEASILSNQFCYLGRVWIPFSIFQFVLIICDKRFRLWISNSLALLHAATYAVVLFPQTNGLYYSSMSFSEEGLFPHIVHTSGIWHIAYDLVIIMYIVYGTWSLLKAIGKAAEGKKRKQLVLILMAIVSDSAFFIMQIIDVIPGYDTTVFGYTIATLFLYLAVFRYDMLGAKELARDFIMENVAEGVIVSDENGNVADFNKSALRIFPEIETTPHDALVLLDRLIAENRTLDIDGRKFTPKEKTLTDNKKTAGKVYLLADDTAHFARTETLIREMMTALSKTVDAKDHYTNGHSQRVALYAREIARRLGKSDEEQEMIYEAGLLHDIGKIGVSEEIINKTSRLTDEEFAAIKTHTVTGWNILRQISAVPELALGARHHHERYDGRGYPDGLSGESIPESARIICVADCYDAMTSTRTYSKPKEQSVVRAEIERCAGSQFDPAAAEAMLSMIDDDKEYRMNEGGGWGRE